MNAIVDPTEAGTSPTAEPIIDAGMKALIKPLRADELTRLEAMLVADGCRDALVVWKERGILLDGHHRYAICKQHGIEFKIAEMSFPDELAAKGWMLENQLGRRNMTTFQRIEVSLNLKVLYAEQARLRQLSGKGDDGSGGRGRRKNLPQNSAEGSRHDAETRVRTARLAGVSHDTVAKAEKIIEKADEATKERLRHGETTINAVFKAVTVNNQHPGVATDPHCKAPSIQAGTSQAVCNAPGSTSRNFVYFRNAWTGIRNAADEFDMASGSLIELAEELNNAKEWSDPVKTLRHAVATVRRAIDKVSPVATAASDPEKGNAG